MGIWFIQGMLNSDECNVLLQLRVGDRKVIPPNYVICSGCITSVQCLMLRLKEILINFVTINNTQSYIYLGHTAVFNQHILKTDVEILIFTSRVSLPVTI